MTQHTSHVTLLDSHVMSHTQHAFNVTCSINSKTMQCVLSLLCIFAAHKVYETHVPVQRALLVSLGLKVMSAREAKAVYS